MKTPLKEPLGFTAVSLLMPCVLLFLQAGCAIHQPTAGLRQGLQGTWEGYRCGKGPTVEHTITITGNSLRYQGTNSSDWYDAAFTLPAQTNPQQMRATITGGFETNFNGQVVRCIIKIEDGTLTLASACGGLDEDPPKNFTDKEYPNYWCYELRKVQPQKTNSEPPKTN
jgi:uncharacterized protein (TIGR03067 family)